MKGDDPTEFVLYDRFEDYMLECMVNEDYLPASDSGLLAAFRVWICFFCLFLFFCTNKNDQCFNRLQYERVVSHYDIDRCRLNSPGAGWGKERVHWRWQTEWPSYKKRHSFPAQRADRLAGVGCGCRCFAQNLCLWSCIKTASAHQLPNIIRISDKGRRFNSSESRLLWGLCDHVQ